MALGPVYGVRGHVDDSTRNRRGAKCVSIASSSIRNIKNPSHTLGIRTASVKGMQPCVPGRRAHGIGHNPAPAGGFNHENISPYSTGLLVILVTVLVRPVGRKRTTRLIRRGKLPRASSGIRIDRIRPTILLRGLDQLTAARVHHGGARRPVWVVIERKWDRLEPPGDRARLWINTQEAQTVINAGFGLGAAAVPATRITSCEVDALAVASRG